MLTASEVANKAKKKDYYFGNLETYSQISLSKQKARLHFFFILFFCYSQNYV